MESRTFEAYLECAGNHRAMFDLVNGRAAQGTQWGTGAVSNAAWTGVPLASVLAAARISSNGVSVMLIGMDVDSPERQAEGVVATTQTIKSALALPWPAGLDTGEHTVMTKATDGAGNTQPDAVPFNCKGYLLNQPVPHPIAVV